MQSKSDRAKNTACFKRLIFIFYQLPVGVIVKKSILVLALLLFAGSTVAETTHREIHKAYEASVNEQLKKCGHEPQIVINRRGEIKSKQNGDYYGVILPDYSVGCVTPAARLVYAINVNGLDITVDGIDYKKDFTGWYETPVNSINDTARRYIYSFAESLPVLWGNGKYRLVAHLKPGGCLGWKYTVNGVVVESTGADKYTVDFTVENFLAAVSYEPSEDCAADVTAVEVWAL